MCVATIYMKGDMVDIDKGPYTRTISLAKYFNRIFIMGFGLTESDDIIKRHLLFEQKLLPIIRSWISYWKLNKKAKNFKFY